MSSQKPETQEKSTRVRLTVQQVIAAGVSVLVLVLTLLCLSMLNVDNVVEQLELKTYDLRSQFQIGGETNRPGKNVMILQFDDASLNALSDDFGVWPWPRDAHANMIRFLNQQAGVRSLLYDIMFVAHRKGSEEADAMLIEAFKKYNNVYLSMNLDNDLHNSQMLGKDLTPWDLKVLKPLSIEVTSDLDQAPADTSLHLRRDEDGHRFFNNNHMTFNNYRSIMPDLLGHNTRIGIINHGADNDGVSRSNPLFFRFRYNAFIKTKALPLHEEEVVANANQQQTENQEPKNSLTDKISPETDGNKIKNPAHQKSQPSEPNHKTQTKSGNPDNQQQNNQKAILPESKIWLDANNHRVDADGYLYRKSGYLPVIRQADGSYRDQDPREPKLTDAQGYLLDDLGNPLYLRDERLSIMYFPYLGLRAALELKYPHEKIKLHITKDGHLQTHNYDIPLTENGDFLVNWYNVNLDREELSKAITQRNLYIDALKAQQKELSKDINLPGLTPQTVSDMHEQIKQAIGQVEKTQIEIETFRNVLKSDYTPQPYKMVSAWQIIRLMKKQERGAAFNAADLALIKELKNKIIFLGATAVATYDIKNTSIHSTLPGVVLQANLFDNLMQNSGHYIHRVPPGVNLFITCILCLLASACTFKMRSALAGLLTAANIALIYALLTIIAFQSFALWINIAMPLVCLIITTTITFMLKYFMSNKDYEKTYALATTDSMTGLYNHRFFQDQMRQSIEQSNRFKHKFSLLLIDIDFFKKFNDNYGHQAGDEVLRQVAKKLQKNVRTVDIVARYGGEEMAIILDRANEEEALIVAQKIVKAIAEEAYPIAEGVSKHITISCGVSTYPSHGETPSQLIEFSDLGLYRAKENGRNQVGAQYDSPPPPGEEHKPDGEPKEAPQQDSDHHAA